MAKYVLRFNVNHNHVVCPKGSEAPEQFVKLFVEQGYVDIIEDDEPKSEPEKKKKIK